MASLLTQQYQAPDTNFVSQIFQNAAAMRQRQAEQAQNYALQIAQETRRAQEAAAQRDFDRQRHEEMIRQFNLKAEFDKGKDVRDAAYDALRNKDYAGRIRERDYDNSVGGTPPGVPGATGTEPALPSDPSVGAVPDGTTAPVELPPLPGATPAQQITAPAPGSSDFVGPLTPAQQIDPVVRPPVPKIVAPAPQVAPPPVAAPGAAPLGLPGPDFTTPPKHQDYAGQIRALDQSLRQLGVRNKAREDVVTDAAKRLTLVEQKAELAGNAPAIDEAAKEAGLTQGEDGGYYKGKTLYNVAIRGGKAYVNPVKSPAEGGLVEDPKNPGTFSKPGSAALYKKDGNGEFVKIGTQAKVSMTLQGADGKPILVMSDGTFQDKDGQQVAPEKVQKIVGALDPAKFAAAGAKDSRQALQEERQFFANEAKRATDEAQKLRTLDLSEKPAEPYAEGGKYYKGKSKATPIEKPVYDQMKAAFDAYQKKIKDAEERASKFQQKVGEVQGRIDGLPADESPAAGAPPAAPGAAAAPKAKAKYVWKDGKLVAE